MSQPRRNARAAKRKARRSALAKRAIGRTLLCLGALIAFALCAVITTAYITFLGPSQTASDYLTTSLLETSALKFVPALFLGDARVAQAVARNSVVESDEVTDAGLVVIPPAATAEPGTSEGEPADDGIEIVNIVGSTYKGYLAIVADPSRVSVGVCADHFSASESGKYVAQIAERYDAVLAINGGGFSDANGQGNGGTPLGLVVSGGRQRSRSDDTYPTIAGFDRDGKLIVGKIDSDRAQSLGIRDAVAFGPALVINGKALSVEGTGSGLNPRTAIGQRADGAVLLLVIDGRQVNSLGASYADLIAVMLEYGAVNACNLDGGSSSVMYYNGEYLNDGTSVIASRKIPTAFVVK